MKINFYMGLYNERISTIQENMIILDTPNL